MLLFPYCFLAKSSFSYWRGILRLNLFLIFRDFEARCSYKIVLIKKECIWINDESFSKYSNICIVNGQENFQKHVSKHGEDLMKNDTK